MSIELQESGFHEWHDYVKGVPGLAIDSKRVDDCVAHYHKHGFGGLFGHPRFGFNQDNLDFLARTKNVKWLWFWDIALKNIAALYELEELSHIGINPKRPGIDFSQFPSLQSAVNHWIKLDTGITESSIKEYYHWHYKPKSKSFEGLEIPSGVKQLHFYWANPATLNGLPVLKKLKVLEIHRCRNLGDLSALPRIAPNLEQLLTTTSSKIDPTAGVLDHPKLKTALIDGRFVLGD